MREATAALLISGCKLRTNGMAFFAAIATAKLKCAATVSALLRRFDADQLPETHTGQILLSRLNFAETTAMRGRAALEEASVQLNLTTTVANTAPKGSCRDCLRVLLKSGVHLGCHSDLP